MAIISRILINKLIMAVISQAIADNPAIISRKRMGSLVITSSQVTINIMRGRTSRPRFPVMQSRSTANMMRADRTRARGMALLP